MTAVDPADEDSVEYARAPHHLPRSQDSPADDFTLPHGGTSTSAVLSPGDSPRHEKVPRFVFANSFREW